ncbi:MAG: hypothetical protein ACE5K2_08185 [Candidatus Zixiibacteriota bacterium]
MDKLRDRRISLIYMEILPPPKVGPDNTGGVLGHPGETRLG